MVPPRRTPDTAAQPGAPQLPDGIAARRLGVAPAPAVVFEDVLAGVAAERAGGLGLEVAADRAGRMDALRAAGADVVVSDLQELAAA